MAWQAKLAAAAISAAFMAGCANTISSVAHNDGASADEGFSYYLPMRHLEVVVERKTRNEQIGALEKALRKTRTAEAAAKTALETQKATVATLERELEILVRAEAAENTVASKRLELAKARVALDLDTRKYESAKATAATALAALLDARDAKAGTVTETAQVRKLGYVPDTTKRFVAKLQHSQLRDDQWQLTTSQSGLLQTANVTPDGKLDDIIVEVGKAALVLTGAVPPGLPAEAAGEDPRVAAGERCARSFRYAYVFNPADPSAEEKVNRDLFQLCSDFRIQVETPANVENGAPAENVEGLAYRREVPFMIILKKCRYADDKPRRACGDNMNSFYSHTTSVALLPNGAPIETLAFEADAVATHSLNSTFSNGMLTDVNFTQRSGVLEVAKTPLRVVNGATTALGDLLTLRVNASSNKNTLMQNETTELNELVNRLKAQQRYDDALKLYEQGEPIPDVGKDDDN